MGKANINILTKGMCDHAMSNPFFKMKDFCDSLLNPDQEIANYKQVADMYDEAPGGAPDGMEIGLANMTGVGLTMIGNLCTPSIVKEIQKNQRTSYIDAQVRKITRNNPVLGTIMNILPNGNRTSYIGGDMPKQVFYEPIQMAFANKYSIYNEDKSEKTEAEKKSVALQIIGILKSSDNMKKLYESGFYLNTDTRNYVASVLHDMYKHTQDEYQAKKAQGLLNPKVLGNGDYAKGVKILQEYNNSYKETLNV